MSEKNFGETGTPYSATFQSMLSLSKHPMRHHKTSQNVSSNSLNKYVGHVYDFLFFEFKRLVYFYFTNCLPRRCLCCTHVDVFSDINISLSSFRFADNCEYIQEGLSNK